MPLTHRRTLLTVVAVFFLASSARAEVILTPFVGGVFGGSTDTSHTTYGGAVGFLGGLFGFEAEFGYVKDYFGTGATAAGLESNKLQSLSGNLILAFPSGPFRPYGTAGLGLLRPEVSGRTGFVDIKQDKGAYNIGGGIFLGLGDHVALRGDLRYFRAFSDLEAGSSSVSLGSLDYWRGVGGLTLRF